LHKFTGWVLLGYLFTHIAVLSTAIGVDPTAATAGADQYTEILRGLEELLVVRVLEIRVVAAATFHLLNGVRLLLVEMSVGISVQDKSFYGSLVAASITTLVSVPVFLAGQL
jgi:succinate dehydrogenase subunit C (EC 1.3.5.1)